MSTFSRQWSQTGKPQALLWRETQRRHFDIDSAPHWRYGKEAATFRLVIGSFGGDFNEEATSDLDGDGAEVGNWV
jgi:hypothetical protein